MNVMQKIPAKMIRKMRNQRFSVATDGVLLYADPFLGRLENETKQLVVGLDWAKQRFELKHQDTITAVFDLADGVEKACRAAFNAYFRMFEALCRQGGEAQPVAA